MDAATLIQKMQELKESFQALYPMVEVNVCIKSVLVNSALYGNVQALCGAFNNIIENAIQASNKCHKNYIDITIAMIKDETIIEFIDYGHGIEKLNIAKINEGFFTTKENGTGLGLSIAKSIVEAHKGRINIDSIVNQFTKISVISFKW